MLSVLRSEIVESRPVRGLTVLAVDDDPWLRFRLKSILSEAGAPYEICADPYDALDRCRKRQSEYGLVLMDIRFPSGNLGFEVSQQIAELGDTSARPPIIGMSGYPNLYKYKAGERWGMIDILPKPLFKWLLINLVQEYCGSQDVA